MHTIESEWLAESQQAMHGWDFSHLAGRCQTEKLPWDYSVWVRQHLTPSDEWLDMDTGGGELMQTFQHPVDKTTVTEGWQPNIDLLKRTLVPQGSRYIRIQKNGWRRFRMSILTLSPTVTAVCRYATLPVCCGRTVSLSHNKSAQLTITACHGF